MYQSTFNSYLWSHMHNTRSFGIVNVAGADCPVLKGTDNRMG
jgi:hypothetical protein